MLRWAIPPSQLARRLLLRAASVGPENEMRPLGVKGGTWVESEANGWRELEKGGKVVKKVESADEFVKKGGEVVQKGGVSRRMVED